MHYVMQLFSSLFEWVLEASRRVIVYVNRMLWNILVDD